MKKYFFIFLCLIIFIGYLITRNSNVEKECIKGFKETEAYELSKAVISQDLKKIIKICKENPDLIYIEDEKFKYTLLHFAVKLNKYDSVKTLLELGMSPNIQSSEFGETPLFIAVKSSDIDIKFIQLLIKYGADTELSVRSMKNHLFTDGETALMQLPSMYVPEQQKNLAKAKFLIETAKACLNAKDVDGHTVAINALQMQDLKMAHYLIVEKKADITQSYYSHDYVLLEGELKREFQPVSILKNWWIYPLDSEEYAIKKEIIEEFERQGIDYNNFEPSTEALKKIKQLYPDNWEEYLKRY